MPFLERQDNGKEIKIICDESIKFDQGSSIQILADDWDRQLTLRSDDGLSQLTWTKVGNIFELRGVTIAGRKFNEDVQIVPNQQDKLKLLDSDFFFLSELTVITPLRQIMSELTVRLSITSILIKYQ